MAQGSGPSEDQCQRRHEDSQIATTAEIYLLAITRFSDLRWPLTLLGNWDGKFTPPTAPMVRTHAGHLKVLVCCAMALHIFQLVKAAGITRIDPDPLNEKAPENNRLGLLDHYYHPLINPDVKNGNDQVGGFEGNRQRL
ncbi:hypothetical protein JTE90_015973 [Oedothorax gibbosus]|uniref:Uncharacterized protein n=1 Tax=Oedothorax gibbosus TaxID=931172 RepID=A0AAV6VQP2_9ARAC|nr:hypothetical protein JTE90_015973 [Oedothorax gibbosus]